MVTKSPRIAHAFERLLPPGIPLELSAYDGSAAGTPGAPNRIELANPDAVSQLLSAPGELGLVRAYVSGNLTVSGDLYTVLDTLLPLLDSLHWREGLTLLRDLAPAHLRRLPRPPEELPGRLWRNTVGTRHSRRRDHAAVSRHYDVSNHFYELVLGPSMAYTCACYPDEQASLETAQFNKFDLVSRKLALGKGMRLLDVGCGWGGMVIHAAKHYGVNALGVTLSREQARWAQKEIVAEGLADRAEVRHMDYRDVPADQYDAVSSIGLTEHIGSRNLPGYFRFLASRLKPQGRLLNHSITRTTTTDRHTVGPFFDRYVFPDGELEGVGEVASAMQDNGFEIRHEENLREHYARTLAGWRANLAANRGAAAADAGAGRTRVWELYMAASQLAFARHQLELHQILGVKVNDEGRSGVPLRPTW